MSPKHRVAGHRGGGRRQRVPALALVQGHVDRLRVGGHRRLRLRRSPARPRGAAELAARITGRSCCSTPSAAICRFSSPTPRPTTAPSGATSTSKRTRKCSTTNLCTAAAPPTPPLARATPFHVPGRERRRGRRRRQATLSSAPPRSQRLRRHARGRPARTRATRRSRHDTAPSAVPCRAPDATRMPTDNSVCCPVRGRHRPAAADATTASTDQSNTNERSAT